MSSVVRTMKLIGYEPVTDENCGFCTGLFSYGKSNEVFIAVPAIEGDSSSTVAGFITVTPHQPEWLSGYEDYTLMVGDEWKDVFLLDGLVIFNTRSELRKYVSLSAPNLIARFPITALDLTREVAGKERRAALGAAHAMIDRRLSARQADAWIIDTYVRGQILTHLRKEMIRRNASTLALEALRNIRIDRDYGSRTLTVTLPGSHDFEPEDVKPLLALKDDNDVRELLSELPYTLSKLRAAGALEDGRLIEHYRPKPILLLAFGRGADTTVRILMERGGKVPYVLDANWPSRLFEKGNSANPEEHDPDSFSVIIAVVAEEKTRRVALEFEQFIQLMRKRPKSVVILAPILPATGPSRYLAFRDQQSFFDQGAAWLRLDTSSVRAPYYPGDMRASLPRRISDLIMQTCLLLVQKPDTIRQYSQALRRNPELLLSLSLDHESFHPDTKTGAPSEAVTVGAQKKWSRIRTRSYIQYHDTSRRGRRRNPNGRYELSAEPARDENIDDLAMTAVTKVVREIRPTVEGVWLQPSEAPYRSDLAFPHMTARIEIDLEVRLNLLITLEAPSIQALITAEQMGLQAIRYCDAGSIKRLLMGRRDRFWERELPDDLVPMITSDKRTYKPLFRRAQEVPAAIIWSDDWEEWQEQFPDSPLASLGYTFLPFATKIGGNGTPLVILPRETMEQEHARASGSDSYEVLESLTEAFIAEHGTFKVIFDETPARHTRWVFRAGKFPILPVELPRDFTVNDDWIVFDGDHFAACVVHSHVFETWLKAHGVIKPGAIPRKAFEDAVNSFPWPPGFSRSVQNEILCHDPPQDLEDACSQVQFGTLSNLSKDIWPGLTALEVHSLERERISHAALRMYDLADTRSEVRALDMLLQHRDR